MFDHIKSGMQSLKPTPREQLRPSHVPADLASCTHVFLQHDGHRKDLLRSLVYTQSSHKLSWQNRSHGDLIYSKVCKTGGVTSPTSRLKTLITDINRVISAQSSLTSVERVGVPTEETEDDEVVATSAILSARSSSVTKSGVEASTMRILAGRRWRKVHEGGTPGCLQLFLRGVAASYAGVA